MYRKIIIRRISAMFLVLTSWGQENKAQEGEFAQIETRKNSIIVYLLEDKLPPVLFEKYLPEMKAKKSAFKPKEVAI